MEKGREEEVRENTVWVAEEGDGAKKANMKIRRCNDDALL